MRASCAAAGSHDRSEELGEMARREDLIKDLCWVIWNTLCLPNTQQRTNQKHEPSHSKHISRAHTHTHARARHHESSPGPHFTLCRQAARRQVVTVAPPSRQCCWNKGGSPLGGWQEDEGAAYHVAALILHKAVAPGLPLKIHGRSQRASRGFFSSSSYFGVSVFPPTNTARWRSGGDTQQGPRTTSMCA